MEPTIGQLVGGALRLDRSTFDLAEHAPDGLRVALAVLLLAGASETLGQAVVLVLNRVSRARFVFALGLGGLELVVEAGLWIVSVWLVAGLLVPARPPLLSAVRVIGLAYAPLLLGVLVFLPCVGPLVARLLRLWVLLAALVGVGVVFDLPPLLAALAVAVGFLGHALLLRLFGGLAAAVDRWRWRVQTGQAMPLRSTDALVPLEPREHHR